MNLCGKKLKEITHCILRHMNITYEHQWSKLDIEALRSPIQFFCATIPVGIQGEAHNLVVMRIAWWIKQPCQKAKNIN